MSKIADLLPCPFCGGKADFSETNAWWVRCNECNAETEADMSPEGAAEYWNKRTPPPSSHVMGIEAALKGLLSIISDSDGVSGYEQDRATPWDEFPEVEAARLTLSTMNREEPHPDDLAVDRFAAVMKAKLAKKRDEGRGGWEDKGQCSNAFLSELLLEHVAKGDPVDVGNLAMMIHQRGESICVLTERVAAISQLHAIVDAWEALPGGRQVRNSDVERWLAQHMGPGIDAIRGFLRRPRPDGILPPPPQTNVALSKTMEDIHSEQLARPRFKPAPQAHVAPDEDAVETVARRIYEDAHKGMSNIWSWNDRGLDDEHPGTRERYLGYARSAIAATPPPVQHVIGFETNKSMLTSFGADNIREGSRMCFGSGGEEDEWEGYYEVPFHVLDGIREALSRPPSSHVAGDHHELLMRLQAVQYGTDRPYAAAVCKDAGDAIKSLVEISKERDHFYNQWQACWAPLTPRSENEKQGFERVLAILKSKLSDGGGIVGPSDVQRAHNDFYRGRRVAFEECAIMLRAALATTEGSTE